MGLNGQNWVIKDTPFDHLTKQNFKQTIRDMGAFNFLSSSSGILSNEERTASSRIGRGKL